MHLVNRTGYSYFFGLRIGEIFFLAIGSTCLGAYLTNAYDTDSVWALAGLSFSFFVLGQIIFMARRCVVFPELACFIACAMWVIAPWMAYTYVHPMPLFQMVIPVDDYMAYATPACIALWVGMHLPLRFSDNLTDSESRKPLNSKERHLMDGLIVCGFLADFLTSYLPLSIRALFYILAQLRFVAALSFLFSMSRGWRIRIAIVYIALFLKTASGAVFYEFVLWSCYLLISLAYLKKWRWKLLFSLVAAFYILMMLNVVKADYRSELSDGQSIPILEKVKILTGLFWEGSNDGLSHDVIAKNVVRWNQGWIIARVMATVPYVEPYADGETIKQAVIASMLPRFLFPDKLFVASQEMFTTYTTAELNENTAMALGVPGEMYANFGLNGGIIATGIYGFLIGFIFSKFARLAKKNMVIWAWVPFVLLVAFEAEWNVYDVLNHLVKSLAVFIAVISLMPILRHLFFAKVKKLVYRVIRPKAAL